MFCKGPAGIGETATDRKSGPNSITCGGFTQMNDVAGSFPTQHTTTLTQGIGHFPVPYRSPQDLYSVIGEILFDTHVGHDRQSNNFRFELVPGFEIQCPQSDHIIPIE